MNRNKRVPSNGQLGRFSLSSRWGSRWVPESDRHSFLSYLIIVYEQGTIWNLDSGYIYKHSPCVYIFFISLFISLFSRKYEHFYHHSVWHSPRRPTCELHEANVAHSLSRRYAAIAGRWHCGRDTQWDTVRVTVRDTVWDSMKHTVTHCDTHFWTHCEHAMKQAVQCIIQCSFVCVSLSLVYGQSMKHQRLSMKVAR